MVSVAVWNLMGFLNGRRRGEDRERGASLVEYALLIGLIAIVCIVAVSFLGNSTSSRFSDMGASLNP